MLSVIGESGTYRTRLDSELSNAGWQAAPHDDLEGAVFHYRADQISHLDSSLD